MTFAVAIVGRPNVGKSTLFNRLVGRTLALVDETPGLTRDRREGAARIGPLRFTAIDTAGVDDPLEAPEGGRDSRQALMRAQTERAVQTADLALLVIDGRAGVTPLDERFADWLRRAGVPVVVAVNKSEGRGGGVQALEAFALGFGDPVAISAKHGEGIEDLYDAIVPYADGTAKRIDDGTEQEGDVRPLTLAIAGRPNTGKSTLVNRLLGEERVIAGPEAGLTRDAIMIQWRYGDQPVRLVDTAGLRRRARIADRVEKMSTADSLRAVRFAELVVLMVDATAPLERQDLTIAGHVADEGRALVLGLNKWDLVEDKQATLKRLRDQLETGLPQLRGLRFVTMSALTGAGLDKLMPTVLETYRRWNARVPTGPLNRWFAERIEGHPPPLVAGRRLKLRYITQVKTRPPTFVVFASRPAELPDAYQRYLVNGIRDAFDLAGVPIRLLLRKGKNPYAED